MLTVKCQGCGAFYKLSEDLYSRKAAGFGVVVTCRRCKSEIHVESQGAASVSPANAAATTDPTPAPQATPDAESPKVVSPSPPRATPKATAPWPEAQTPSPASTATAPSDEWPDAPGGEDAVTIPPAASPAPAPVASPAPAPTPPAPAAKPKTALLAESPSPPRATGAFPRPAPRPAAPAGPKPLAKRDPVSGPFVALSPGLLGGAKPPSSPDSEAPVDSSDFIDETRKGASPKAPPVRRSADAHKAPPANAEQKAPPVRRTAEPALPLKFKGPPKPPKHKPRAPLRSDDVSEDLLSADVGFEGAPPLEREPLRILAPTSSALAAPPPEPEAERESPQPGATVPSPSTSDARSRPSSSAKPSRLVPIALVSLAAVGAFVLAFRSQLPDGAAPKAERPAADDHGAAASAPAPSPAEPLAPAPAENVPMPPPIETTAATATPASPRSGTSPPAAAPRTDGVSSPKPGSNSPPPATPSATPKPAVTAAAPGTPEPPDAPRAKPEGPFNADAARSALAGAVAQASSCRKPGDPSGVAQVTITFSPSGRVTSANIAGPPFAGTPTGGCIAATLRRARVPAFEGEMVTVRKTVEIH